MKKIQYIAIVLVLMVVASCKKSFLNLTPQDQVSEASYYQTTTHTEPIHWVFQQALNNKKILTR